MALAALTVVLAWVLPESLPGAAPPGWAAAALNSLPAELGSAPVLVVLGYSLMAPMALLGWSLGSRPLGPSRVRRG